MSPIDNEKPNPDAPRVGAAPVEDVRQMGPDGNSELKSFFARPGFISAAKFWLPLTVVCGGIYLGATNEKVVSLLETSYTKASETITTTTDFRITKLRITGRKNIIKEKVIEAAGFESGQSALSFNAAEVRQKLLQSPWIKDADVIMEPPHTVHIQLTEREPVALWQVNGRFFVIEDTGDRIIELMEQKESYRNLPYIVGVGANLEVEEAQRIYRNAPRSIRQKIGAMIRIGQRRWDIQLIDGPTISLPEIEPMFALRKIEELDQKSNLMLRDIVRIDLRRPFDLPILQITQDAVDYREQLLQEQASDGA